MNLHYFLVYNPFLPKYDSLATLPPCVDSGDASVYAQRYPKNVRALSNVYDYIFHFPSNYDDSIRPTKHQLNLEQYSYSTSFIDKQSYLSLPLFRTVEHSTGDDNNDGSVLG